MPDSIQSYWEVLEPLFSRIDIYNSPEDYADAIAALPRHVVLLYATHMFLAEVYNGGLLQFFWNNTGVIAPESVEGFRMMGMSEIATLLETIASGLGKPYPRCRNDRWDALLLSSGRKRTRIETNLQKIRKPLHRVC